MGRRKGDWKCGKTNSIGNRCTRMNHWSSDECDRCFKKRNIAGEDYE